MHYKLASAAAAVLAIVATSPAHAQQYVGSWEVDQGPNWTSDPTAFSGVDAAALLFGGSPSDYVISTLGNDPSTINDLSWISTYGVPDGQQVADTFVVSSSGHYSTFGDTSAYVWDNAQGASYTNYAFRINAAVPEPSTWAMMLVGFGAIGVAMRRKPVAKTQLA